MNDNIITYTNYTIYTTFTNNTLPPPPISRQINNNTIDRVSSAEIVNLLQYFEEDYISWQIDRTPDRPTLPNNDIQFVIDETLVITEEELHCCICLEDKERINICSLNCGHTFCETCVNKCINLPQQYNCSLCREKVTIVKKCE